jgi:hypothetical protein
MQRPPLSATLTGSIAAAGTGEIWEGADAGRGGDAAQERQGHAQHRAMTHEFASVYLTVQQHVDQVILMLGAAAPEQIEQAKIFGHFEASQSVFVFNTLS